MVGSLAWWQRPGMSLLLFLFAFLASCPPSSAEEWNCSSTHGNFTRMEDCQLDKEILLTGDLAIAGRKSLTTVIASTENRHFKLTTQKLSLSYLNLTGGNVQGHSSNQNGGSIFMSDNGGSVVARFCLFFDNKASYGGTLYGWGGSFMKIYDSNISNSIAKYRGGALYMNHGFVYDTRHIHG